MVFEKQKVDDKNKVPNLKTAFQNLSQILDVGQWLTDSGLGR